MTIPAEFLWHVVPFLDDVDQGNMSLANKLLQGGVNRWYEHKLTKFNALVKERFSDDVELEVFNERVRAQVNYNGNRCLYLTARKTPLRTKVLQLEDGQRPFSFRLSPTGNKIAILLCPSTNQNWGSPSNCIRRAQIFDFTTNECVFMQQGTENAEERETKIEWISDRKILTKLSFRRGHELFLEEANSAWACTRVPGEFRDGCVRNSKEIFLVGIADGQMRVDVSSFNTGDESLLQKFSIDVGQLWDDARLFIYVCDDKWLLISLYGVLPDSEKTHLYVYNIDTCQQVCEQQVDLHAELVQAAGNSMFFFARCEDSSDVTTLKVDESGSISTGFSFPVPADFGRFILAASQFHVVVRGDRTVHIFDQKSGKRCCSLSVGLYACATVSSDQKELCVLDGTGILNVFCLEKPLV